MDTDQIRDKFNKFLKEGFYMMLNYTFNFIKMIIPSPQRTPSGLLNRSLVCYMNAMIQAAASIDLIIYKFEYLKSSYSDCVSLNIFLELLHGVNKSGNSFETINRNTVLLEELIRSIGWDKPSQQDAFDLFASIIKGIEEEMKNKIDEDFRKLMKVKLVHRFTGIDIPEKIQYHLGLSVGLCGNYSKRPGESLEYLINEHFSPTIIDDDSSKTTQMFFYQQAPDVLLIHIQANKWNHEREEMVKPEYYIKYKKRMTLRLNTVILGEEPKQIIATYRLKAVIRHNGTISGGHYVTYREYKDKWYLLDDDQTKKIEFDCSIAPYIMIYERIN